MQARLKIARRETKKKEMEKSKGKSVDNEIAREESNIFEVGNSKAKKETRGNRLTTTQRVARKIIKEGQSNVINNTQSDEVARVQLGILNVAEEAGLNNHYPVNV